MSNCVDVASEQVCYIPCNFCSIILAVSVPCTSLFDIVTVRCGHCSHLWSVNMAAAVQSLSWNNPQTASFSSKDHHVDHGSSSTCNRMTTASFSSKDHHVDHGSSSTCNRMTVRAPRSTNDKRMENHPPEKRQRVPSPYNQFIKEEIQRIKANNPHISHKEAFSTAAKNWAHFPHIRFGLMLETSNQAKAAEGPEKQLMMNF